MHQFNGTEVLKPEQGACLEAPISDVPRSYCFIRPRTLETRQWKLTAFVQAVGSECVVMNCICTAEDSSGFGFYCVPPATFAPLSRVRQIVVAVAVRTKSRRGILPSDDLFFFMFSLLSHLFFTRTELSGSQAPRTCEFFVSLPPALRLYCLCNAFSPENFH